MKDYSLYKDLYLKCFADDTEEDAEILFSTVLSKAKKVCEYSDEKPIAMLFLMDSKLIAKDYEYPFYYLYAACTHPDYRGRGIMGGLLEKAKQVAVDDGKLGIFLKPANPPLFDFYKKSDFLPFFSYTKITATAKDFLTRVNITPLSFKKIGMKDWQTKRISFLNDLTDLYAHFSDDLFTAATVGCSAILSEKSAAVYELRDDTLLIKEAMCHIGYEQELLCLVAELLKSTKAKDVELRLPPVYSPFAFDGFKVSTTPFSVIWHNDCFKKELFEYPYHGFAFD